MPTSLVRLPPDAWPTLAGLVHALNQRPHGGPRCLHAARGADEASHAAELAALAPGEAVFWAVMDDGTRAGVFGCEFDPALRRGWLRGPLVADDRLLDPLLPLARPALESALPAIDCFDAFPSADDAPLNAWYAAAGFEAMQVHRVLRAPVGASSIGRPDAGTTSLDSPAGPVTIRRATPADLPAALALHQSLFPNAYLGEAEFRRALLEPDRALFVATDAGDGGAVAYLHAQDDPIEHEAYVDYLGVSPAHRGRGLGLALLDAAAGWAAANGRGHVALTVSEDRPSALNLYHHAGFAQISAGRQWRWTVSQAG